MEKLSKFQSKIRTDDDKFFPEKDEEKTGKELMYGKPIFDDDLLD